MKNINLIILLSLILSGCKKVSIYNEFSKLRSITKELTCFDIYKNNPICNIDAQLVNGISREQAIDIALSHNPTLQASFEGLGIAKSELLQAGLYSNPKANAAVYFPFKNSSADVSIGGQSPVNVSTGSQSPAAEAALYFSISDLWQVPLRKYVKEDELEIVSLSILELILDIIAQTRKAFDTILYLKEQIKINEKIIDQTIKLRDDIYAKNEVGLKSDLEKNSSDISISKANIEIIKLKKELHQAYIDLKKIMGIHPTSTPIHLNQKLYHYSWNIPSLETLEQCALTYRVELRRAQIMIKQYEDELNLEKARVFKDVNLGIAYQKDFGIQGEGLGPAINLEIPFFDFNQAQISKREYLLNQAIKKFEAEKISILQEVNFNYEELMAAIHQKKIYKENIVAKNKNILESTKKHEKEKQITNDVILQAHITVYENTKQLISIYYDIHNAFTNLERSVGKKLEGICYES